MDFTAHNIRLDNGEMTKPEVGVSMDAHHLLVSAKRVLNTIFQGDKSRYRLADLGCLEGGYSVEFARMGFQVLGLEVRESNFAACCYVKERTNLPNLQFVRDDAWNLAKYGSFDAVFCCGLFYHLDRPREFLRLLSDVTTRTLILNTHFANKRLLMSAHEGLRGRWYSEFRNDAEFRNRDKMRWASWDNRRSFWIQREYLLQEMKNVGFSTVLEQFDCLSDITAPYDRGMFIGVKN
jgi:hypothetical protein